MDFGGWGDILGGYGTTKVPGRGVGVCGEALVATSFSGSK